MLTLDVIRTWLAVRCQPPIDEHALASASKLDPLLATSWERSSLIDDLLQDAHIVKAGLASESFEAAFRERLAQETESVEAAQAIWEAA